MNLSIEPSKLFNRELYHINDQFGEIENVNRNFDEHQIYLNSVYSSEF